MKSFIYGIRTGLCLFVLSILTLSSTGLVNALDVDFDSSGVHINRDCQSTPGSSVLLDDSYDIAEKYIMLFPADYNDHTHVYINICGKAAGETWDAPSHAIYVVTVEKGWQCIGSFNAHDWFSTSEFEWRKMEILPQYFSVFDGFYGTSNTIIIEDITNSQTYENLYVGIDTFRPTFDDFERSYWDTTGNPTDNQYECNGELSIWLEFQDVKYNIYNADPISETQAYIDDNQDYATKYFDLTYANLQDVIAGEIYIYGHGFGGNYGHSYPPVAMFIAINDLQIFFNVEDVFGENNQWCWGAIGFPVQGHLFNGNNNVVMIHDDTENTESQNLAIGIDTDTDDDESEWQYNYQGNWYGGWCPQYCTGELMIGMRLFHAYGAPTISTFSTICCASYYYGNYNLSQGSTHWIRDDLLNRGWLCVLEKYNEDIYEGDFYLQGCANDADFIYFHGHSESNCVKLYYYLPYNNQANPMDQSAFRIRYHYRSGVGYVDTLECDWSADGLDKEPEWIFFDSCEIISGSSFPPSNNSQFQQLLYHGAHFLFGYWYEICESNPSYLLVQYFNYFAFGNPQLGIQPHSVNDAYEMANNIDGVSPWAYYCHSGNYGEYLWGVDSGPNADSYEHDDLIFDWSGLF